VAPTVGVTADRRAEEQELLFRRHGIDVIRASAMGTVLETDDGTLRATSDKLLADPPRFLIADTGIGMRSWFAAVPELPAALATAGTRIAVRGPKAQGAVRSAGLEAWWRAPTEQLATVVDHVLAHASPGDRIALQLHGEDEGPTIARLEAAGTEVIPVPVYRWTGPADPDAVVALVEAAVSGDLAAVTFTSAPAVHNLMSLARRAGLESGLVEAFDSTVLAACIGPVCAQAGTEEGVGRMIVPEHWRLGSMVSLVVAELAGRS
jgi:uroporphyrinogen-III synthase